VCCAETYIFFPVFTMLSMFKISICESWILRICR
jgi:hypothetical protein